METESVTLLGWQERFGAEYGRVERHVLSGPRRDRLQSIITCLQSARQ